MITTVISAAVSCDGCMDDCSDNRLVLSCRKDWEEVYRLRASCDAILVGAQTVRSDNPSLVIRDEELRRLRTERGMTADITKVVVSASGMLDSSLRFFTEGSAARKIVICNDSTPTEHTEALSGAAEIVRLHEITAAAIKKALEAKGIRTLMVEGGAKILKMFFDENEADYVRLAVSPVNVDECDAPRLPYFGALPFEDSCKRKAIRRIGDMTVYEYTLHGNSSFDFGSLREDRPHYANDDAAQYAKEKRLLRQAVDLSRLSEPCDTAYRVGCVIETRTGAIFEGYTHETGAHNHAEEEAVAKAVTAGADLSAATIYTSMEPCSKRASKPVSCSEIIINCKMAKVVYAYAEPDHFVKCDATRRLVAAGIEVCTIPEFAREVADINSHILGK